MRAVIADRGFDEGAVGLAVTEAVTNVVRHSKARSCRLSVIERHGNCELEIEDDGQRVAEDAAPGARPEMPVTEGQGLRGMRERIEASGGTIAQRIGPGTKLTIKLPLIANAEGVG